MKKQTLRNIAIGATIFGTGLLMNYDKYQKTIEQTPSYGMSSSSTTLTDVDEDGSWDIADNVEIGYTPGSLSRTLYYKKGFGPAQSVDAKVVTVDAEFFNQY